MAEPKSYEACVQTSERVRWRVADVLPPDAILDFSRPFMPETLAQVRDLTCLDEEARLRLNHIRGFAYCHLFTFVEEYIVATAMRHAEVEMFGNETTLRALLQFAEEEVKHQALFKRFQQIFREQFGSPISGVGNAEAVAGVILEKSPAAVMLVTLHLELLTQKHFVEAFKDESEIDPLFKSLFKHHWMEEAQHSKLDVLELHKMLDGISREIVHASVSDYLDVLIAFRGILTEQASLDLESLNRTLSSPLEEAAMADVLRVQAHAYHRTFLTMGMTNPMFLSELEDLLPIDERERILNAVPAMN